VTPIEVRAARAGYRVPAERYDALRETLERPEAFASRWGLPPFVAEAERALDVIVVYDGGYPVPPVFLAIPSASSTFVFRSRDEGGGAPYALMLRRIAPLLRAIRYTGPLLARLVPGTRELRSGGFSAAPDLPVWSALGSLFPEPGALFEEPRAAGDPIRAIAVSIVAEAHEPLESLADSWLWPTTSSRVDVTARGHDAGAAFGTAKARAKSLGARHVDVRTLAREVRGATGSFKRRGLLS
jgi:hypothetical protein